MKFTTEELISLGDQGQKLAMDIYYKGYKDCYNHTKCMSDTEKEVYMNSLGGK